MANCCPALGGSGTATWCPCSLSQDTWPDFSDVWHVFIGSFLFWWTLFLCVVVSPLKDLASRHFYMLKFVMTSSLKRTDYLERGQVISMHQDPMTELSLTHGILLELWPLLFLSFSLLISSHLFSSLISLMSTMYIAVPSRLRRLRRAGWELTIKFLKTLELLLRMSCFNFFPLFLKNTKDRV